MKRAFFLSLIVISASASLSACGRRGPLEVPSAAANPQSGETAEATPVEDKPFVLDGLVK